MWCTRVYKRVSSRTGEFIFYLTRQTCTYLWLCYFRDMCKMQVDGISNNIYEGFDSRADAERAYVLAYALGAVRVLANAGGDVQRNADPNPTLEAFMRVLRDAPDDFLGQEWHVVFKGKRPGVYPSWAFAANQTISVGRSVYQKYAIRADAMSAYQRARENGEIERL